MVTIKSKHKRQLIITDKKQYVLDAGSEQGAKKKEELIKVVTELKSPIFYCPFCLSFGKLSAFEYKTPKGNVSKGVKCPDCKNKMLRKSITNTMSAEQYAEWVFDYRKSGFWQKCNFAVWNERLYKLGLSHRFWEKYRLLKGEHKADETYYDHLDKEQEEWAKEQGLTEQGGDEER